MSTKVNRRVKADDMLSVASEDELQATIFKIGRLQTRLEIATAQTNETINNAKAQLKTVTKGINDEIKVLTKSAQIFFTANQLDIVPAGKKSKRYEQGEIGTRTPPLSVTIKNSDAVLTQLKELQTQLELSELITTKESINKAGLVKHREKVAGVSGIKFNQTEQFFIKPMYVPIEHLESTEAEA